MGQEDEVGLGALTQNEKDVFYASYTEIYLAGGTEKSVDIKKHALLIGMAQPTFHSCLKALTGRGLLSHAPNTKASSHTSPIVQREGCSSVVLRRVLWIVLRMTLVRF